MSYTRTQTRRKGQYVIYTHKWFISVVGTYFLEIDEKKTFSLLSPPQLKG